MPRGFSRLACAALAASCIASVPMLIERAAQAQQPTQGAPDDPALLPEQTLGRRFTVKAEDMPRPYSGAVVSNRSLTLPYDGQVPRVPEGFTATLFASGLAYEASFFPVGADPDFRYSHWLITSSCVAAVILFLKRRAIRPPAPS